MIPLILMKGTTSLKKELIVVCLIMAFLFFMPIFALIAITNVGALGAAFTDGNEVSNAAPGSGPQNIHLYTGSNYPGDKYDFGNCTYWTYMRRAQVGEPIGDNWGNASSWAFNAFLQGYHIDHTPSKYAVMQISTVAHGLGHVAFVEKVDPDGTWHISEMNVMGFDIVDDQTMPALAASDYNFIHDKVPVL